MALWSSWLPDVLPHVPACPTIVVEHELRRAAQILLEASRAWRIDLAVQAVTADTETVEPIMADPVEQELVRIEAVEYDGKALALTSVEILEAEAGEGWAGHTGAPTCYTLFSPGVVRLYPIPLEDAISGVKFRVSLKPADTAAGIPDEIRVKYKEPIAAGAKARLMIYKDRPWTDYALAGVHGSAFESGIAKATYDAARSFGAGRIPSRPRWC